METLIKLNNQTAGRDRIARLLQYLSRVIWHRLQNTNKDRAAGIKNLEYQLSTFRKVLRFGRCIDILYSALPVFREEDQTVRYTVILSKVCSTLFLLGDHMLWLGRTDLCSVQTDKWTQISVKYWLYSIAFNLARDFYEISNLLHAEKRLVCSEKNANCVDVSRNMLFCLLRNKNVLIDTIKNGCDLFIPLSALGHVKLSPGMVGMLGVVSSLAGLFVIINPKLRLSP